MVAAFHRGDITLRKLRVLVKYLPQESPVYWRRTDDRPYDLKTDLAWQTLWVLLGLLVTTRKAYGDKSAEMPSDDMPRFPWSELVRANQSKLGHVPPELAEQAQAWLDSL
ncbi:MULTISPECIES: hypothetical protein [Tomitella]|uniref:Uncharacterized protein n=1 Tax=Tomitella cavernea TaxID=1387982 RepID=A0ABP9CFF2_9ACTN|nr:MULTISPECIES: hypothetical protein [Tomitella]